MHSRFRGCRAAGKDIVVMARPSKHSPELRRRSVIEVIEKGRPSGAGRSHPPNRFDHRHVVVVIGSCSG